MRILMVLERDFPPDLRVENEIKSLISAGHQLTIVCYSLKEDSQVFDWHGCTVYKKKIPGFIYKSSVGALRFPFYFNFWRKHLTQVIKTIEPDAIHIHDLPLASLGSYFKKKRGLKFVLDLHENWPAYLEVSSHTKGLLGTFLSNNKQWQNYELKQCNNADKVIVVVDEARERLIQLGITANKIVVVSNYPELSDFENLSISQQPTDKIVLFYAGGINEHRGLQYIIRALPLLRNNLGVELRIFGKGNYMDSLKALAQKLHVDSQVIFFGQVPYKTVLEELMKATITLIPHTKNSHTDSTIPHKLFQYIFAGKPVLVSNCAPIERIVNEINAGAVYTWNNPQEAAQKLMEIIDNKGSFEPSRLQQTITSKYNWELEVQKLQMIYNT